MNRLIVSVAVLVCNRRVQMTRQLDDVDFDSKPIFFLVVKIQALS